MAGTSTPKTAQETSNAKKVCPLRRCSGLFKRYKNDSDYFKLSLAERILAFCSCFALMAFCYFLSCKKLLIASTNHLVVYRLLLTLGHIIFMFIMPGFFLGFKRFYNDIFMQWPA